MSFLQPWILAALPLVALPILIHLINRNRHRSVHWGAMMFLIKANRMNKGMARLRYVIIMLLRMAAVAAIIVAIGRPLFSGKLGGLGQGAPDATLILLDRSASMEARDLQSGDSKRSTALKKLAELLEKRGHGSQLVLIDSATGDARSIESPKALLDLPLTRPTATSGNLPGMFETALAYLQANESGRADVWICSDLQATDWNPDSGRWASVREQFSGMKGVHHFLLSYTGRPVGNLSIRVANVKRRPSRSGNQAELILDVFLNEETQGEPAGAMARRVPVEFEIDNVRSTVDMELNAGGASLLGHRIPINRETRSGWGSVSVPGDANPLDNRFYFVFSEPPVRRAIIVSDDPKTGDAFRKCLAIPTESDVQHDADVIPAARIGEVDLEHLALLVWQAPLPAGPVAEQIAQFVASGRVVMFFPPDRVTDARFLDMQWRDWQPVEDGDQRKLSWWRNDADLLANVGSGEALPLSELRTYRYCPTESSEGHRPGTPLAKLGDEQPLLERMATDRGSVYFCHTLPTAQFSSLERDAVSFFVLLQRAMEDGSRSLASASQRDAGGGLTVNLADYQQMAPVNDAPTISERGLQPGVYRDGDDWIAVNRSIEEDRSDVTPATTVDQLFAGLAYERIDDEIGDTSSLASEVWRAFLFLMALALMLEALLCLPKKKAGPTAKGTFTPAVS